MIPESAHAELSVESSEKAPVGMVTATTSPPSNADLGKFNRYFPVGNVDMYRIAKWIERRIEGRIDRQMDR